MGLKKIGEGRVGGAVGREPAVQFQFLISIIIIWPQRNEIKKSIELQAH